MRAVLFASFYLYFILHLKIIVLQNIYYQKNLNYQFISGSGRRIICTIPDWNRLFQIAAFAGISDGDLSMNTKSWKYIAAFVFLIMAASAVSAASAPAADDAGPLYEWIKEFSPDNGSVNTVWQLLDNSYVAGGNNNGRILIGISESGVLEWEKSIPGGDENGSVKFVEESLTGGLYIFTDGENLMKTSVAGDVEWTFHQPFGVVNSVEISGSGYVLLGGDYYQAFLTLVSPEGNEVWNKTIESSQGGGQLRITSVQNTNDGSFIVAGYINPIIYTGKYCGFAMKINPDGDIVWEKQYGYDNSAMIITITPLDDGSFAAGLVEITEAEISMTEDNSAYAPSILIIDENGSEILKYEVSGAEVIYYIKGAADGGYYLLASRYNALSDFTDFMLIKTDSKAQTLWTKNFGETRISSLQTASDGGLVLCGIDENTKKGAIIKTAPDCDNTNKTPGFGIIAALISVFCAAFNCRLKK